LLDSLAPGDVVLASRLGEPARSTGDLLNTLAAITQNRRSLRKRKPVSVPSATQGGHEDRTPAADAK
jgi:hypothetical protein